MNANIAWWITLILWIIFSIGYMISKALDLENSQILFCSLQFSMCGFLFVFLGFVHNWW